MYCGTRVPSAPRETVCISLRRAGGRGELPIGIGKRRGRRTVLEPVGFRGARLGNGFIAEKVEHGALRSRGV